MTYILFNHGHFVLCESAEHEAHLTSMLRPGEWLRADEIPAGLGAMTIIDGALVPAPAELLAERQRLHEDAARHNSLEHERDDLRRALRKSDYKALKFAEGSLSETGFAPIRAERQEWRARINEIEQELEG